MALNPTKTWEYLPNISRSGANLTARNQELWLAFKQMLTNTGSIQAVDQAGSNISLTAPFTVVASSNTVTADASDNWNSVSDIVASATGSWIHLRLVDYFGSGDHLNMLMSARDVTNGSIGRMAWVRGALGYNADGTTTALPTVEAGETEIVTRDGSGPTGNVLGSATMWANDSINNPAVLQGRISDDGQCGAVWMFIGGNCVASYGWQRDEEGPGAEHTNDFCVWGLSQDNVIEMWLWSTGSTFNTLEPFFTLDNAGVRYDMGATMPCYGAAETPAIEDNGSVSRFLFPIFLISGTQNLVAGVLTDMWWGASTEVSGDGSPVTPPAVRRQIGQMVIPWASGVTFTVS